MQNGLKYSIADAQANAQMLRQYATQMESDLQSSKQRIEALCANEEFRTVAASLAFFEKIDQAAANFPKFIEAIRKFADFLDQYVAQNYQETDTSARQLQSQMEASLSDLQNSGNLGA